MTTLGKAKAISLLQRVGQSLMVPVSVLPAAGILVALGRFFETEAKELAAGSLLQMVLSSVGPVIFQGGLAVFVHLAAVFAIGVAIGFTGGAGVAGLAALVGYVTLEAVLKEMGTLLQLETAINTGVFGGIIIGLMVAYLYNRFHKTRLHPIFGFFSGKRLVPILAGLSAVGLGVLFGFIWPPVQDAINQFGQLVMSSPIGPAFYAAGKRLLIPVGLHHVYYPPFLYEFGEFVSATGQVFRGESARFYAGDPTAGRFMASEFPVMLFALPAAALAMVLRARPEKRKAVGGVMLTAALTSIITGITEPIEFAFIFVAPLLFLFHVAGAFISGILTNAFDIQLGYAFSASLIDYVIAADLPAAQNGSRLFFVVGPIMGMLYFSVFYFAIPFFNLKTIGRETPEEALAESAGLPAGDSRAVGVLGALGGAKNIKTLDACITRLRVTVNDPSQVVVDRFKELGASGVFAAPGGNFQIVFGVESDLLKEEILQLMSHEEPPLELGSPFQGALMNIDQVPDRTFAEKILGDGFAVLPDEGVAFAPADGTIAMIHRAKHAFGIETDQGVEVLVHVGLDTVHLNGEGFRPLVKTGERVKKGQKVLEFDIGLIERNGKSLISPVVVTNMGSGKEFTLRRVGPVRPADGVAEIR